MPLLKGVGVFLSPNQGQVWNLMSGSVGNPLIINLYDGQDTNVNPDSTPFPEWGPRADCSGCTRAGDRQYGRQRGL